VNGVNSDKNTVMRMQIRFWSKKIWESIILIPHF